MRVLLVLALLCTAVGAGCAILQPPPRDVTAPPLPCYDPNDVFQSDIDDSSGRLEKPCVKPVPK